MLISLIILCALLYLSLLGFKTAYALVALANMPETHSAAKRFRVSGESAQAEVTIVQPLLSGDPRLQQVLATNLQTLPEQAFLWLIDRDDAPCDHPKQRDVADDVYDKHLRDVLVVLEQLLLRV